MLENLLTEGKLNNKKYNKIKNSLSLDKIKLAQETHLFLFCLVFNWDSLHARLNSHDEAWS